MKSYASAAAAAAVPGDTMGSSTSTSELVQTFKQKAAFMKLWRPASQPSVRVFVFVCVSVWCVCLIMISVCCPMAVLGLLLQLVLY